MKGERVRKREMALPFVTKAVPFLKAWARLKLWPRNTNHTIKSCGLLTKNNCQTHTSHILVVVIKPSFLSIVHVVLNLHQNCVDNCLLQYTAQHYLITKMCLAGGRWKLKKTASLSATHLVPQKSGLKVCERQMVKHCINGVMCACRQPRKWGWAKVCDWKLQEPHAMLSCLRKGTRRLDIAFLVLYNHSSSA